MPGTEQFLQYALDKGFDPRTFQKTGNANVPAAKVYVETKSEDIIDLIFRLDIIKTQSDGAQVFIKQVNGKYNVIVEGNNGVITSLKNISENSLNKL